MENIPACYAMLILMSTNHVQRIILRQNISPTPLSTNATFVTKHFTIGLPWTTTELENTNNFASCFPGGAPQFTDPSQLDQYLQRLEDGKYQCVICYSFSHVGITCARNHVESIHFPDSFTYLCNICNDSFKTKKKLYNHTATRHKNK